MQRVKELDSIRGLASLAIVVYHLWLSNPFMPGPGSLKLLKDRFGYQRDAALTGFGEGREQVPHVTAPAGLDNAFELARSLTSAKASTAKAR